MNPESSATTSRGSNPKKPPHDDPSAETGPCWKFPGPPLALTILFLAFVLFPQVRANPRLVWTFAGVAAALAGWAFLLWAVAKRENRSFRIELAPVLRSHYVQASVQICIYIYWGWYWRKVYSEVPLILAQLVFLYIFDALLSWSRGRSWRLGFGPLPIILSTNVFIWFKDEYFIYQFLLIATAALGKEFIKWHWNGKKTHIFNPSAFGLGVFSFVLILTETTHYTWGVEVATTIGNPPHIYLQIFLLGLIVQYFFSVTLMTLSAAAVLFLLERIYFAITDSYFFVDTNLPIAIFLGLHLLVTDPSTSPKTNVGRVIFGGLYGLGNFVLYWVFEEFGVPEFYDKLLPVLALNLSVRWIDRFARSGVLGRFTRWESLFQPRKLNLIHMGCWAALFLAMLTSGYVEAPHEGVSIAYWKKAVADGKFNAGKKLLKVVGAQANGGSAVAANELGMIYMEGKVAPKDRAAAAHYFATACELGDGEGCANLAAQFLFLHEARSDQDVARALQRLEQECGSGTDGRSCHLIGFAYETGRGRSVDKKRARELYREGCQRGDLDACKGLVRLMASETNGKEDLSEAAQYLEKACAKGDAESCLYLSYVCRGGNGIQGDEIGALALLDKACRLGSKQACEALRQSASGSPAPPR